MSVGGGRHKKNVFTHGHVNDNEFVKWEGASSEIGGGGGGGTP